MLKSSISIREITHEEFMNLKRGDVVFVKLDNTYYKSKVIGEPFYNYDSNDPDWEVITTNGFCDEYSLYVYNENN